MEDARAFVELSIDRGVAVATLNRPEVRNAVDERIRVAVPQVRIPQVRVEIPEVNIPEVRVEVPEVDVDSVVAGDDNL